SSTSQFSNCAANTEWRIRPEKHANTNVALCQAEQSLRRTRTCPSRSSTPPIFTTGLESLTFSSLSLPAMISQPLGVYQVQGLIGRGGMGEVYRARDTKLNRNVAIKVLLPAVAN